MENNSNLNANSIDTTPKGSESPSSQVFFTQQPLNIEGPKPIHLIYYNQQDKTFRVSEEAKTFLKSIKERVGVISVAGKYRTGKSFLLNRVIINKHNQGFGVGPTINPCTKGLWIWGDTLEGEYQGDKLKILLIDSEGIGAFDEDENHDTKIFLLALLLCSYFIYNSMGTIDENAINNLSLIINLSKELQIKSDVLGESDPEEIAKYFPSFLWVVRDFSLKLLDQENNTITSKQYLESAIQPQKGGSDQVETKNRIRRLIKTFFNDRDCYTLVRPVEEEKALQSLQSMPDTELRSEFVNQVNQLRQKIFKRVRPKSLNSKFITGEMLLELCYAYTEAINIGSIPNIQNAWSYVCQNECQRAINESVSTYEQHMRRILLDAKDLCNEDLIRKEHKVRRDEAVVIFKSKAVGQDIQEYESQLREGMSKKYKDIKQEFTRFCKSKSHQFLEADISNIKRNLQNDMYENLDKFMEDIEKLRQKYNEKGPIFSGKSEIFTEVAMSLVSRAADFLTISTKKETDVNLKKLKERVEELEREKQTLKLDLNTDKKLLEQKVHDLEQDKNNSIRNEKLMEERLKYIQEDREKSEKSGNDKWKKKLEEKDDHIRILEMKLKNLETHGKNKEDEGFKRQNEFEKLNALIEQKLQLTENELSDYKNKYSQKDLDYKEINKELYSTRKEIQQLTNQIYRNEQDKTDEIKQIRQEYDNQINDLQRQINQGTSGNPQVTSDSSVDAKERLQMQSQISLLSQNLVEQTKKMQEFMMAQMQQQQQQQKPVNSDRSSNDGKVEKLKQQNNELLITNHNLSSQIKLMQTKQHNLESTISDLRQYKLMYRFAIAIQCKNCNKLYPKNQYQQHLPSCNRENERMSTINAHQNIYPIEIMISTCTKEENDYCYEMTIEKNHQQWKVVKKIGEFTYLFEDLYSQFPTYSMPFIPEEWLQNTKDEFYLVELKKKLQIFMIDLARIPFIRENATFKLFLEMENNFVDDEYFSNASGMDPRRGMQSIGGQNSSNFNAHSQSFNSRQSVLSPFTSLNNNNNNNMIMVNAKSMEGRKSVSPMLNNHTSILHTSQNQSENQQKLTRQQQQYGMKLTDQSQIQELIEDEDYSSIATNRISQMMQMSEENMDSRQSVFSVKGGTQEFKMDQIMNTQNISKVNSPFQQVDGFSVSKSKERYSNMRSEQYYETNTLAAGVGVMIDDNEFEDSFTTNDIGTGGDMSASSKNQVIDDDIYPSLRINQQDSSPATKANLSKRFDEQSTSKSAIGSSMGHSQKKSIYNRYDNNEKEEEQINSNSAKKGQNNLDICDDDLARE